jgi:hypothetical protein
VDGSIFETFPSEPSMPQWIQLSIAPERPTGIGPRSPLTGMTSGEHCWKRAALLSINGLI